jgi:O-antigen ligase
MFFEFWTIKGKGADYPSPFMFHIDYSVFLGFTAIVLLNRMLSKRYDLKEKLLLTLFFLTVTGNLFINDGRTGQLAFFVGIIATVFIHFKINFKSIAIATLLISVLSVGAYQLSSKFQQRVAAAQSDIQKITEGNLDSSWGYRIAMYSVASDIFKENPIIGVGVGDYQQASYDALQKDDHGFSKAFQEFLPKRHFHNQYLNVLVQGGLVGLILMMSIFYYLFKLSIHDPELKELSLLFGVVMLTAFVAEPLWLKQFTNMLFILFIGLFLGASLHGKPLADNT